MKELLFATSNPLKLHVAKHVVEQCGFTIRQTHITVPEIQATDGETVARDKAEKVFAKVQKPVIVSDDSWLIAGLRGFPGPYMQSVNQWFTVDDWLHLTQPLTNRRITLRQLIVYQDRVQQKVFFTDVEGILLPEPRGESPIVFMALVSFDGGKTTVAERFAQSQSPILEHRTSWHDLCEWLQNDQSIPSQQR